MKGLVVTPAYFPDKSKGGSITGCRSFAKAISLIHQLEIGTLDTTNEGERVSEVDEIKVSYFKITKGLEWLSSSGWGFSLKFSFWFIKNYKKFDYIYIRSLWNYISLFTSIICILTGKNYGISSSGKFSKYALRSSFTKKIIILPLILFILKKASFIHYPTTKEYNSTPKYISKLTKPIILNTAIDIKENLSEESNKSPIIKRKLIYTVSRFDEIKRIEIIAKLSSERFPNIDFVHIGNYQDNFGYFNKIKNIYKNNKITINYKFDNLIDFDKPAQRVFFPGYMEINAVDELIKQYQESYFMQMSYSEGQSNSILEAMARGSTCIVSEGCNMQKAKEHDSIIIANEHNLIREINKLWKKDLLMDKLRDNQYKFLKDFHSSKNISIQFDENIRSLL